MEKTLNVTLLRHTYDPQELVALAAKLCYSKAEIEDLRNAIEAKSQTKFVQKIMSMGHESVLEHASFTFGIEGVSRTLLAQITRHRLASFCVSGDTVVGYDAKNKGVTIAELSTKTPQYLHMSKLRSVNEDSKEIIMNPIVQVFSNGIKPVYELKTDDGYVIKATKEHLFLTPSGWVSLADLRVSDFVYTNGVPAYQQIDWLRTKYCEENLSQRDIGQLCGVSHHTIRAWVRKFNLQKPLGSWCIGKAPRNKGQTKNTYEPLMRTSQKRTGVGHPSPFKQDYDSAQGYKDTAANGYNCVARYFPKTGTCQRCGVSDGATEVHHQDVNPQHFTASNLIELCRICHKRIHKGASVKAVKPSVIVSIDYVGEEAVYDLEMAAPYHNYVANGFVVHNCVQSQRYVSYEQGFGYIIPPSIKKLGSEAVAEYERQMAQMHEWYKGWQVLLGNVGESSNEDARFVLPGACETRMMVTMNIRELRHFFTMRECSRAQWEIRELAKQMHNLCNTIAPELFADAGPGCVRGHCPEGEKSCGHPWPKYNKKEKSE